ncbi:MAG: hypothetical protein PHR68_04545 [Candidatus Gracilibacteria bacterium]|nr:hypothetical protein [Candidatus Gracilibacteria bacterium]
MKDKLISFGAGILIGALLLSGYYYIMGPKGQGPGNFSGGQRGQMMNPKNMSDSQLEKMATRVGMTKDELKKEIDSGKDLKTIMQEKGVNFGSRGGSGTTNSGNFGGRQTTSE